MYFLAVSVLWSTYGYDLRQAMKVIGARTKYDSDILPFGVLQEVLRLQGSKAKRKPVQSKTRPVTVKIYKDLDFNQYQTENQMKKINYLRGVENYYEFSGHDQSSLYNSGDIYNGDAFSVLPYGRKQFMLVDKEGDDIVNFQYVNQEGVPRIRKVEPIVIGNKIQEHIFLEVKK